MAQRVFFTSDLHIHHPSILRHCSERQEAMGVTAEDLDGHDKWLIDLWNSTVERNDIVYILGDFSFANGKWTEKVLQRLKGEKHLIIGNHDKSSERVETSRYFRSMAHIKEVVFKPIAHPFLESEFRVIMCHYPLVTWNNKHMGAVHCHGHAHGRLDDYNEKNPDLRVDVGIDGKLAQYKFATLEQLYNHFMEKTECVRFAKYVADKRAEQII